MLCRSLSDTLARWTLALLSFSPFCGVAPRRSAWLLIILPVFRCVAIPAQSRLNMTPLSYDMLEYASPFQSEQCPEGVVCVSGNTLR